jgi:hypothetical protein
VEQKNTMAGQNYGMLNNQAGGVMPPHATKENLSPKAFHYT